MKKIKYIYVIYDRNKNIVIATFDYYDLAEKYLYDVYNDDNLRILSVPL